MASLSMLEMRDFSPRLIWYHVNVEVVHAEPPDPIKIYVPLMITRFRIAILLILQYIYIQNPVVSRI